MFRRMMIRSSMAKKPSAPLVRPISAASGNMFPQQIADPLVAFAMPSPLWLTETQMAVAGVKLLPEQKGKGYDVVSDGSTFTLYNASQTSDPARIEAMKGKLRCVNAVSGEKIFSDFASVLGANKGTYQSNSWILAQDAAALGLKVKAGVEPITVTVQYNTEGESTSRTSTHSFYNEESLDDSKVLQKIQKLYPTSAASGKRYAHSLAMKLLRVALDNNFDSQYWLTMSGAATLNVVIKDATAGTDVVISNKSMTFFNASQTSNPQAVKAAAYKAQYAPRSAMSRATYPEPTSSQLAQVALKKHHRSVFWLTEKQATFLGVQILPNQEPTEIVMNEGIVRLYNADQTNDRKALEAVKGKN
jgi:antirestriction protein ArdC